MPRIMTFRMAHPDIALMLDPTAAIVEPRPGGIDVAVRYRDRRRPVENLRPVLVSDMIVIGAASLIEGRDLSEPASLVHLPWLQELGTNEASDWFTFHGVVPERPLTLTHMPGNLIMNAVRRGDGVTYTARAFFREDLASGRVVELFSETAFGIYHVETQPEPLLPAVRTFLDWLFSEAETVTA